jgi:hypothetical protein
MAARILHSYSKTLGSRLHSKGVYVSNVATPQWVQRKQSINSGFQRLWELHAENAWHQKRAIYNEEKGVVALGTAAVKHGFQTGAVHAARSGAGALQGGEAGSIAGSVGGIFGAVVGAIGSEFLWQQYEHHEKEIEQECRETGHHH